MKELKNLGYDLKERRLEKKLSQLHVACYCGVSCTAYQRWEGGSTKSIKDEHYEKLVEVLG